MFGIGTQELVIILIIALIIFGPGKLPDLGNSIGKAIKNFKKTIAEPDDKSNELSAVKKKEPFYKRD